MKRILVALAFERGEKAPPPYPAPRDGYFISREVIR
jgi:hypothetical protein